MNRSDAPKKQPVPFGINGQREDLLPTTPAGDNTASYGLGFPPITMILKAAGGKPPKGQDMNQILFELSALSRWSSSGAQNTYDQSFAASIGGYPSGSYVMGDDLKTIYRCTTDGNTTNPNSSSAGWAKVAQDIADILSLGTAAYRSVGTGSGNIPDMSSFNAGTINAFKLPTGHIVQFDSGTTSLGGLIKPFPVPFPQVCQMCVGIVLNTTEARTFVSSNITDRTLANLTFVDSTGSGLNNIFVGYIAVGR